MKVKQIMAAIIADCLMTMAIAEVSVTGVKVQPRSPWNGLVDIEYVVACADPQQEVYVHPVAYDGDRRMTLFMDCLTGDGATSTVKAGKHKMTWDSVRDYGVFSSANFQVKVYAGKRMPKYIKIDLSSGTESDNYPVTMSFDGPDVIKDDCRTTELWLRLVLPGEFWMGSPKDELGRTDNEDLHHVTLTKPFYMGVFEVTQKQYELVMGSNPSTFKDTENAFKRPVETVPWDQIRGVDDPASNEMARDSFLTRLRTRTHSLAFDLPSEARWEYACRAGTTTALYNGKNLSTVDECEALNEIARNYANGWGEGTMNVSNELYGTATVGSYKPNKLGLYDMLGNVWELCRDGESSPNSYHPYRESIIRTGYDDCVDPLAIGFYYNGGKSGSWYHFLIRGGTFDCRASACRVATRKTMQVYRGGFADRGAGFRVCSELEF